VHRGLQEIGDEHGVEEGGATAGTVTGTEAENLLEIVATNRVSGSAIQRARLARAASRIPERRKSAK